MATNPYLADQANAITNQANTNLMTNQLPAINRGAVANGGYGGSRQGIAQGIAIGQTNQGVANSLASLYGNAYTADQANQTQQNIANGQLGLGYFNGQTTRDLGFGNLQNQATANAQNYQLGLGGLQNTATANNQNFYTAQRGQDLTQQSQGFNQYLQSLNAQLGMGAQQTAIGQQQQTAAWSPVQNYANLISPFSGLNGSTTSGTSATGGGVAGAAGGALTAAQLWALLSKTGG